MPPGDPPKMIDDAVLPRVLERALRRGGDFADCFVERKETTSVSMEDRRIERVQAGTEQGAGVRVQHRLATAYAYTDELTEAGLLRAADAAAAAVRSAGAETTSIVDLREQRTREQ